SPRVALPLLFRPAALAVLQKPPGHSRSHGSKLNWHSILLSPESYHSCPCAVFGERLSRHGWCASADDSGRCRLRSKRSTESLWPQRVPLHKHLYRCRSDRETDFEDHSQ